MCGQSERYLLLFYLVTKGDDRFLFQFRRWITLWKTNWGARSQPGNTKVQ